MTFSLWFIFLINVDQLFPTLQVVDIYTQLSTGYLYASNGLSAYQVITATMVNNLLSDVLHDSILLLPLAADL